MMDHAKTAFFDRIADQWDGWEDLPALRERLQAGLQAFAVAGDERVLDIGCGTGNLTLALLEQLAPGGNVVAVDFAERMVSAARSKVSDPRVEWHVADAGHLPVADGSCDRAICFSVWPHFDDPAAIAREMRRALRPGGQLHVWHLISRAKVNEIHAGAGEAVCRDLLPPAKETAALLDEQGFTVDAAHESDDHYLVSATRR